MCETQLIQLMSDQTIDDMGDTQRLGNYDSEIIKGSRAYD